MVGIMTVSLKSLHVRAPFGKGSLRLPDTAPYGSSPRECGVRYRIVASEQDLENEQRSIVSAVGRARRSTNASPVAQNFDKRHVSRLLRLHDVESGRVAGARARHVRCSSSNNPPSGAGCRLHAPDRAQCSIARRVGVRWNEPTSSLPGNVRFGPEADIAKCASITTQQLRTSAVQVAHPIGDRAIVLVARCLVLPGWRKFLVVGGDACAAASLMVREKIAAAFDTQAAL